MTETRWYKLIDHACRECGGRLLQSAPDEDGYVHVRCAECGLTATDKEGAAHLVICHCGLRCRDGRDARLRCIPNPNRKLPVDSEVAVVYEHEPGQRRVAQPRRPVQIADES